MKVVESKGVCGHAQIQKMFPREGGGGAKNNCTCLRGVRSDVYFMQFTKYGLWDTSIFGRTSDRNKQNQA